MARNWLLSRGEITIGWARMRWYPLAAWLLAAVLGLAVPTVTEAAGPGGRSSWTRIRGNPSKEWR